MSRTFTSSVAEHWTGIASFSARCTRRKVSNGIWSLLPAVSMISCRTGRARTSRRSAGCFYVGMTRARHQLMMTYARRRNDKGKKPSPFLQEAKLPEKDNVGVFKWSDPDTGGGKSPDAAGQSASKNGCAVSQATGPATGGVGKRKSYRKQGREVPDPTRRVREDLIQRGPGLQGRTFSSAMHLNFILPISDHVK